MAKEDSGRIQVLERAAQILELFTPERMEWRFSDIVLESGLTKSTVFNIVNTLRELKFMEQDEETKKYRLGRQMLRFGEIAKKSIQISKIAHPYMIQLRDIFNETVQVAKLDQNNTIYLDKVESIQSVQTQTMVGAVLPAYATGLGKAILAYKDEAYIDQYFSMQFKQFTSNTLKGKEELKKELFKIRENGYACDNEEFSTGLICYACPIFDYKGKAAYAISISSPAYRMTNEKAEEMKRKLMEIARIISRQIGYRGV